MSMLSAVPVLMVDDDPIVARLLTEPPRLAGHHIRRVAGASEALNVSRG